MKNMISILPVLLLSQALNCAIQVAPAASVKTNDTATMPANETKNNNLVIKVVSGKEIMTSSDEGKKIELDLTQKRSKIEAQGQKMEQELKSDFSKIQSKAKIMDSASLEKHQDDLMRKEKEFKAKMESLQEEFGRVVNRDLAKFNTKINNKIMDIAKSSNWDIVALKETGEIIYASDKVSATDEIVKALNKEFSIQNKPSESIAAPAA